MARKLKALIDTPKSDDEIARCRTILRRTL